MYQLKIIDCCCVSRGKVERHKIMQLITISVLISNTQMFKILDVGKNLSKMQLYPPKNKFINNIELNKTLR